MYALARNIDTNGATRDLGPQGGPSTADAEPLPRAGDRVGPFRIEYEIGAGGMGAVYLATDCRTGKSLALKLPTSSASSEETKRRLLREAEALALVEHAAIPALLDVGIAGGRVYIATEYVDGITMREWRRFSARPWRDVVRGMLDIARALDAVHSKGLIHRDIKPANLMRGADGRSWLIDFGLARAWAPSALDSVADALPNPRTRPSITGAGCLVGTPAYMAPEQIEFCAVSPSSDQFAFFATLYELIFGERPFEGDTPIQVISSILDGQRRPLPEGHGVPASVVRVIERGLSRAPDERWPSMEEAARALESASRRWPMSLIGASKRA